MATTSVPAPAMSTTPPLEERAEMDPFDSIASSPLSVVEAPPPPKSLKRRRSTALTPPLSASDAEQTPTLTKALHVLATEATALSHVTRLYETDPVARTGLLRAIDAIETANTNGGKLIICGVGKSGLVGRKTVATMKSLGLGASFLHAAEAVHGDLGDVRHNDAVLFISFSGRTGELLNLLPHIADDIPVLALTAHTHPDTCPLLDGRENGILLPAPIHESEERSFGVSAPTTSTTVAMAIGDMLAIAAAERIYDTRASKVFKKNHPGGAIGAATLAAAAKRQKKGEHH